MITGNNLHFHAGDWRDVDWPAPCVVITDPPYGISYASNYRGGFHGRRIAGDHSLEERTAALARLNWTALAMWSGARDPIRSPEDLVALLVWDKGGISGMGDLSIPWKPNWERVEIYGHGWVGKRTSSVVRAVVPRWWGGVIEAHRAVRKHPAEKPLLVLRDLVGKAPPGLPICDPFAGVGGVGVACVELGREFWGSEIDPEYAAEACQRLGLTPAAPLFGGDST